MELMSFGGEGRDGSRLGLPGLQCQGLGLEGIAECRESCIRCLLADLGKFLRPLPIVYRSRNCSFPSVDDFVCVLLVSLCMRLIDSFSRLAPSLLSVLGLCALRDPAERAILSVPESEGDIRIWLQVLEEYLAQLTVGEKKNMWYYKQTQT